MKKIGCFLIAITMFILPFMFIGCDDTNNGEQIEYNIFMPDGATALSLSYMMEFPMMNFYSEMGKTTADKQSEAAVMSAKINYNVVPVATIASYVQSEKGDMVVLPVNAAVNLYNKGASYKLAAVLTHGNLFVIGAEGAVDTNQGLSALKGKIIATIGKGGIPELVLKTLLSLSDVEFEEGDTRKPDKAVLTFAEDGEYAIGLLNGGKADVAFIAEPAVTNAANKPALGVKELFNIQDQWTQLTGLSGYPQSGLFVKDGLNPDFTNEFLRLLTAADGWAAANPAAAVAIAKNHALEGTEIKLPAVTKEIVERCNIFAKTEGLSQYINGFYDALPSGVTAARPNDNGIYVGE